MQAMVAAIQNGDGLCVIKWTGRKGLKVVALTYCGDNVNAADGVLQVPTTGVFCAKCTAAVG